MVAIVNCTKFWAMLNAFDGTSKSLEPWARGTVLGNKVYGPEVDVSLYEGTVSNLYLNIAQIHTEKANMGLNSNSHCDSVRYGASGSAELLQRDEASSQAADIVARYGLEGVHRLISEKPLGVEVWTFDNELYVKSADSSEFHTLEPHLEARSLSRRGDENERELVFTATSATNSAGDIPFSFEAFVQGVLRQIDENDNTICSDGGCYFRMVNQHKWENNNSRCGEVTAMVLLQESDSKCPFVPGCLYVREGPANGGDNHRATTAYGSDFKGVDGSSCNSYQLVSAKQFNCGNN